jgi:hypothetical protein
MAETLSAMAETLSAVVTTLSAADLVARGDGPAGADMAKAGETSL